MHTTLPHIPLEYDVLLDANKQYRSAKDRISRAVKNGEYLRLRHGLYYPAKDAGEITTEKKWLIANHLYGPSYVSAQSVLSHFGIIPEAALTITSCTIHRAKSFPTLVGDFVYKKVPQNYFSVGLTLTRDNAVAALAAKALCDMVVCKRSGRIQSMSGMSRYLLDDLRLDTDMLFSVQTREEVCAIMREAGASGIKTGELALLARVLEVL